jgi:hypothetical protein
MGFNSFHPPWVTLIPSLVVSFGRPYLRPVVVSVTTLPDPSWRASSIVIGVPSPR